MEPSKIRLLSDFKVRPGYFEAEEEFISLPLEEKVLLLINYKPTIFQIEPTTRCNLNCPLCSTHHLKRGVIDLETNSFENLVTSNPQMRYATLHLMGEPLLSRNLFQYIRLLKQREVFTFFSTNGMLLKEKAKNVVDSMVDKVSISLDAINQEDLKIYRRNAQLDLILDGIRTLVNERNRRKLDRPIVQVQTIMFRYNEEKEEEVKSFLLSLGVDRIKLKTVSTESFGQKNSNGSDIPWERLIPQRYKRNQKEKLFFKDRAVCRLLFQGFVLADGSVVPCCVDYDGKYAFGNLKVSSWDEIWYSEKRREVLKEYFEEGLTICKNCTMCYEYAWEVGGKQP